MISRASIFLLLMGLLLGNASLQAAPAKKGKGATADTAKLPPPPTDAEAGTDAAAAPTVGDAKPADAAKGDAKGDTAKSDAGKSDPKAGGPGLNADMEGIEFKDLGADLIEYTADGGMKLTGNAYFNSDQLSLKGNQIIYDKASKLMTSTGSPVHIQQGTVKAECRNFKYNTETKQSNLRGDPRIIQINEKGDETDIIGPEIVLKQDAKGGTSLTVQGGPSQIVKKPGKKPEPIKPGKGPATKVKGGDTDIIKVPSLD